MGILRTMKKPWLLLALVSFSLVVSGCNRGDGHDHAHDPNAPKDGLKELVIEDVKVGTGLEWEESDRPVEPGDRVYVTYTGTFRDGRVFDSNDKEGAVPFSFVVGQGMVIRGWDEGLVGMVPGGVRKLQVPYDKAYGPGGQPPAIPPYSDLYFEIKLLDVLKDPLGDEGRAFDRIDVKPGTGAVVEPGSKVTVHYVVQLVNGNQVDSSRDRGQAHTFVVGDETVIPGLDYGIRGMREGGVRRLRIPPRIGFRGLEDNLPPDSITIWEVEVLNVN
jgi:FKBP-type peptidyl-prolyl cis-trans isomerase